MFSLLKEIFDFLCALGRDKVWQISEKPTTVGPPDRHSISTSHINNDIYLRIYGLEPIMKYVWLTKSGIFDIKCHMGAVPRHLSFYMLG